MTARGRIIAGDCRARHGAAVPAQCYRRSLPFAGHLASDGVVDVDPLQCGVVVAVACPFKDPCALTVVGAWGEAGAVA